MGYSKYISVYFGSKESICVEENIVISIDKVQMFCPFIVRGRRKKMSITGERRMVREREGEPK